MLSENSIVSICSHSKGTQFQDFPKQDDAPTHSRVAAATPETLGKNCLWSSVISDPVTLVSIDWSQSPTKHVNVILRMFTLSCRGMTASYGEKKKPDFQLDDFHGLLMVQSWPGSLIAAEFSQRTLHEQAWQAWKDGSRHVVQQWQNSWGSQKWEFSLQYIYLVKFRVCFLHLPKVPSLILDHSIFPFQWCTHQKRFILNKLVSQSASKPCVFDIRCIKESFRQSKTKSILSRYTGWLMRFDRLAMDQNPLYRW